MESTAFAKDWTGKKVNLFFEPDKNLLLIFIIGDNDTNQGPPFKCGKKEYEKIKNLLTSKLKFGILKESMCILGERQIEKNKKHQFQYDQPSKKHILCQFERDEKIDLVESILPVIWDFFEKNKK